MIYDSALRILILILTSITRLSLEDLTWNFVRKVMQEKKEKNADGQYSSYPHSGDHKKRP